MAVVNEEFGHPRLAARYDALNPDRGDLEAYVDLVVELGAERVLDVGGGTGSVALLLAARGHDVVGVGRGVLGGGAGQGWRGPISCIDGDATSVTVMDRDVALLTGNTAQAISDPGQWVATLQTIQACLRPGGHLAFETRNPAARAWEQWTRAATCRVHDVPGTGEVERWVEVTAVEWPLVSFRWTWIFASDGATLTSSSTLRSVTGSRSSGACTSAATSWSTCAAHRTVPARSSSSWPAVGIEPGSPAAHTVGTDVRPRTAVLVTGRR